MDADTARILDANANRAREAIRVMEDHARFVLDDARLSEALKRLRHELAAALGSVGADRAIVFRDTTGDVGTEITTAAERSRASQSDVLRAAGKRLSEALRVIEEYGKRVDAPFAARVEQLRYRGYDLEKRIVHVAVARARFGQVRLYVLITESLCRLPWQDVVREAAAGGANCFQLREKGLTDRALLERAIEFRKICQEVGGLCIINDRADIAAAACADGVHVGQDDMDVPSARRIVGPDAIVGVSTHSVDQAKAASTLCPDYIAVGPMYSTALKPEYGVAGPEMLRAVRQETSLPLVAIGGIDADRAAELVEPGASAVAVCTAVTSADDPKDVSGRIIAGIAGPISA